MKLMQWRRIEGSDENITSLELWITVDGSNWYHYTNPLFSNFKQPERHVEGIRVSKGFSTAAHCLKLGFKYVDKDGNLV